MYYQILSLHSYFRWFIILTIIGQIIWLYIGHRLSKTFTYKDYIILLIMTALYNIQFILGLVLYTQSPLVQSFWSNISLGIKIRELRFFGLEHIIMMGLAIILINFITCRVYKKIGTSCFTYLLSRYIWIILIIFSSIPWSFSPFTNRPNWR